MTNIASLVPLAGSEIADFSIAFAKLSVRGREEDAEPVGSGALVSVGSIQGILTAAHVLRRLPDHGEVGLVRFTKSPIVQKQTIDMGLAEKMLIGGDHKDDDQPRSPDIGFLRLTPDQAGTLNATCVFFNLSKRIESVLKDAHPSGEYFEGLSGVIAERTKGNLAGEAGFNRQKGFSGLFGVGCVVGSVEHDGYNLVDFEVSYDEGTNTPFDFGGMSGGALWRVYIKQNCAGPSISDKRIFGVAFHQSKIVEGKRTITCHGPKSIYDALIRKIETTWRSDR